MRSRFFALLLAILMVITPVLPTGDHLAITIAYADTSDINEDDIQPDPVPAPEEKAAEPDPSPEPTQEPEPTESPAPEAETTSEPTDTPEQADESKSETSESIFIEMNRVCL